MQKFIKNIMYKVSRIVIGFYARVMLRIDIRWMGDLPEGPVIIAANHPSATDPFLIHLVSRKPVSVCITHTAFSVPVLGPYMDYIHQIQVTPGQGERTLRRAIQKMSMGKSVAIFPEGLVSPQEGGFHQPRTGTARLALDSGIPVVPVGISLNRSLSKCITSGISGSKTTAWWYLRGPYVVTVGKPSLYKGKSEDRETVHSATRQIMDSIHSLVQESEKRMMKKKQGLASG